MVERREESEEEAQMSEKVFTPEEIVEFDAVMEEGLNLADSILKDFVGKSTSNADTGRRMKVLSVAATHIQATVMYSAFRNAGVSLTKMIRHADIDLKRHLDNFTRLQDSDFKVMEQNGIVRNGEEVGNELREEKKGPTPV